MANCLDRHRMDALYTVVHESRGVPLPSTKVSSCKNQKQVDRSKSSKLAIPCSISRPLLNTKLDVVDSAINNV